MSTPFTDGRSCKDWLKTIPLTNPGQVQRTILDALRGSNRADLPPLERLTCMELLRDKVAFAQSEQRAKFASKTIPLSQADAGSWQNSTDLLEAMGAGYRLCFDAVKAGSADVEPHLALIIERMMRYIGLEMLFANYFYRRFNPGLWLHVHLLWVEAESRGLARTKVKDSVGSTEGVSNITSAYAAILLAQQARTHELSPKQMDFVDALLKRFAAKVELTLTPPESRTGLQLSVDLFANGGAAYNLNTPPGDRIRFLDVSALSKSLRGRIAKLDEGEVPANLNLPVEWTGAETQLLLKRLHKIWCEGEPPRAAGVVPSETEAIMCFGAEEIHYFMSGSVFEQPGRKRELSRQELNDIAMFGVVKESTLRAVYGDIKFSTEPWGIVDEAREFLRVIRPTASRHGVAVGKLAGIRIGAAGNLLLASVAAVVHEADGNIFVTLRIWPGTPQAMAMRSTDMRTRPGSHFAPGFGLPAVPALGVPETLLIPSGLAAPGRGLDVALSGQADSKEVTVFEFVERGSDFDRVAFF